MVTGQSPIALEWTLCPRKKEEKKTRVFVHIRLSPFRALVFYFPGAVAQGAHAAVPAVPELERRKGDGVAIDGSER